MTIVDTSESTFDPTKPYVPPNIPAEGQAHFLIIGLKEDASATTLQLEVLAHTNPASAKLKMYDRHNLQGKAVHRAFLLARALGVMTNEDWITSQAAGTKINIPFKDFIGRTFCSSIKHTVSKGRTYPNLTWDYFDPATPEAAEYPKDLRFVKKPKAIPSEVAATGAPFES